MINHNIFLVFILISCVQVQGADKYTDQNRPYEFGFSIDGEQHRHEKKDENGIIMGEFGFITADGVYHVTVYATDENGKFKILSMKNIRVKPYPGTSAPSAKSVDKGPERGRSLSYSPNQNNQIPTTTTTERPKLTAKNIFLPAKSCSHCGLPTSTTTTTKPEVENSNPVYSTNSIVTGNTFNSQSRKVAQSSFPGLEATDDQNYNNPVQNPEFNQNVQNSGNIEYKQNEQKLGEFNNNQQSDYQQNLQKSNSGQQKSEIYSPASYNNQQISNSQSNAFNNRFGNPNPGETGIQNNYNNINAKESGSYTKNSNGFNSFNAQIPGIQDNHNNINTEVYGSDNKQTNAPQTNLQSPGLLNSYYNKNSESYNDNDQDLPKKQASLFGERNPKQIGNINQNIVTSRQQNINYEGSVGTIQKPQLFSAQMQIVPKNTDIYQKKPGEKEGLPDGLSKSDMEHLLYTFNYTVGFHGHFEEGYTSGTKQGYYYVTGRNGVRTRVDYVADENGFRPKITQEVLDLLSDDVPKPETEKEEKYGLKGYEFKWLYFPTGTKR